MARQLSGDSMPMTSLKLGDYLDDVLQKIDFKAYYKESKNQLLINPVQPKQFAHYDMDDNSINVLDGNRKSRLKLGSTEYRFHTNFPIKGSLKYFEMKRQFPSVVHISDYAYDVYGKRLYEYKALYIKWNWLYVSPTDFAHKVYGKKPTVFKFDTCTDRENWILVKRKKRHKKLERRQYENTKSN